MLPHADNDTRFGAIGLVVRVIMSSTLAIAVRATAIGGVPVDRLRPAWAQKAAG